MSDYSNEPAVKEIKGHEGDKDTLEVFEPIGELLELEFEGVDERRTEETKWEVEGRGVLAYFGTDGDRGNGAVGREFYVMVDESPEGSDEAGAVVIEVLVPRDVL